VGNVNKIGMLLGFLALVVALAVAPMPLMVELQDPTRDVVLYPNLLFAIPLILLGALLLLYGSTAGNRHGSVDQLPVTTYRFEKR